MTGVSGRPESPRRPAAAYAAMAAVLGARYFTTPPPPSGIRLTVWAGADRVATQWLVAAPLATRAASAAKARGLGVRADPYRLVAPR